MKTLVYGSINIDLIFSVDHIGAPGETISCTSFSKSAGGKGANQAAALAKAGMDTYMAGKIGKDGKFLLILLESYGVHTEKVFHYDGPSGEAIIQVDKNGENTIVLFPGGNGLVIPEEADRVLSAFGEGDLVLLQNEIANTDYIIKKAKSRGIKIAVNPSPWDLRARVLPLELADMLFVNEIEGAGLAEMSPEVPAQKILERLCVIFPKTEVILTIGKDGALYGCGENRAKGEIVDIPVIDTTAAGDCFSGYFIASRELGHSIEASLNFACKAASITVSREGAMESIPFKDEVF